MKITKILAEVLFYLLVSAVLLSRAAMQVVSHDENQFVAAGQALAEHGWLPYRDYPYTHMPYAVAFYALSTKLSPYAYLGARILGTLTWLGCIALMIVIARLVGRSFFKLPAGEPPWAVLLGEFTLVTVFLYHPDSAYVLGAALNQSFATLFSLLAFLFFILVVTRRISMRAGTFWGAASISMAACIRLNFASLVVVLFAIWLAYIWVTERHAVTNWLISFSAGLFVAALPALILIAIAPAGAYYTNVVYIKLNTLYYQSILFDQTMDLPSKIHAFLTGLIHSPLNLGLYLLALAAALFFIVHFVRARSPLDLIGLAAAGFAGALFVSSFSPTPTQAHYFFAPLPFMLVLAAICMAALYVRSAVGHILASLAMLTLLWLTIGNPHPLQQLSALEKPSAWPPIEVHKFAESLGPKYGLPGGRILSLLPVVTAEAGYEPYPFTIAGPFPWRTSLLLSASRRAYYGVTSPQELAATLDAAPPVAIITGFETANAGFTFKDLGGLENPFIDYARQHGYQSIPVTPGFYGHTLLLWVRQP